MNRLSLPLRRTVFCAAGLAATAVAFAQTTAPPGTPLPGTPLDRMIFTVGILVILSQAMEAVFTAATELWGMIFKKPAKQANTTPTPEIFMHPLRLVGAVALALLSGISTTEMLDTGRMVPISIHLDGTLLGVLITGLLCSLGSAFLKKLLELLKALHDVQNQKVQFLSDQRTNAAVEKIVVV
jgi:hypothetical protein